MNDSLGDRMKEYENIERHYLTRRAPVIIRLDGKSFHNFTRGFEKPFDDSFLECMRQTAFQLCENIEGAKLAYTQSDEITILLTDDDTLETQAWFNKNLQKIVSVSAAMCTYFFNKNWECIVNEGTASMGMQVAYKSNRMPIFDARAFVVPREEVLNCFEWRQQDCIRNSILAVGQANFSHNQLNNRSCNEIKKMLFEKKNIVWDALDIPYKRGICVVKAPLAFTTPEGEWLTRDRWTIDKNIPIFHEYPQYIEQWVYHHG